MQYWSGLKLVVSALWKSKRKSEERETRVSRFRTGSLNHSPVGKVGNRTINLTGASATGSEYNYNCSDRRASAKSRKGDRERQSQSEVGGRKAGEIRRESEGVSVLREARKENEQPIIQIVASASSLSLSADPQQRHPVTASPAINPCKSLIRSNSAGPHIHSHSSFSNINSSNRVGIVEENPSRKQSSSSITGIATKISLRRLKESKLSLLGDLKRKFSATSIVTTNANGSNTLEEILTPDGSSPSHSTSSTESKNSYSSLVTQGFNTASLTPNSANINPNKRWKNIARTRSSTSIMDHEDLITELPQIEKLSNQERLRLAHKRRMLQLKKFSHYEKEWSSKKNKMLQNELKKNKKNSPRIRFRNSIMLLEAAGRNDVEEVRKLLESGLDPDVANEDGLTALHQCCIDDNEEMMKVLLDHGANVNSEDSEKWTPLHAAATCGHLHLVKYLIVKGANLLAVNAEGNMPYDICDEEGTLDFIESEMAKRGVTQELIEEIRALPETRMLQDMQIIQSEGGDLEYRDADSATPLHIASANGYIRVVEFLLDNHVATDVQDKDYWQPIHAAACWGHVDVLELLVQNGADLNARTKNNETPYAICEDPEIKERIIQLRSEQETKLQDAARRKIRRSQSSNSRTQSIRRTSQRDKGLTTKRDVADEAQMLMAREINIKDNSPSPTHDMAEKANGLNHNSNLNHNQHETSSEEDGEDKFKSKPPAAFGKDSISELKLGVKEMERLSAIAVKSGAFPSNKLANNANNQYSNPIAIPVTDSNANLPKPEVNPPVDSKVQIGIVNELPTKFEAPASPTLSLRRYAGDPGEIVGDYSDGGKKCCVIV